MTRAVLIGGVAAGMSAATRARREDPDLDIVVLERSPDVSYGASGIPHVVSGEISGFDRLVLRTHTELQRQGVDVRVDQEAVGLRLEDREVDVLDRRTGGQYAVAFDRLLLATGAEPIIPDLAGVSLPGVHAVRTLESGRLLCHDLARGARRIVVVGGGHVGIVMAEALRKRGLEVTLVERRLRLLRSVDEEISTLVRHALEVNGVRVMLGTPVLGFEGRERVQRAVTANGALAADAVVLAAGARPASGLAVEAGLPIDEHGAIVVDDHMRTSVPHVYAAGDVAQVINLVTGRPGRRAPGDTANKQGRVAGTNLSGGDAVFAGAVGTAVMRVFGLAVARTGLTSAEARVEGFQPRSVSVTSLDHAHYYPDTAGLSLQLVYDRFDGRLLGAQLAGRGDAVKRVDVIAALLRVGGSLQTLADLDLSYGPAFAPVQEPLLLAANQALRDSPQAWGAHLPADTEPRATAA